MRIPDSPFIQAKMPEQLTLAMNRYCREYGLSRSEATNRILSEKFGIPYFGARSQAIAIIAQKDAEIAKLKAELDNQNQLAIKQERMEKARVSMLSDQFTVEKG